MRGSEELGVAMSGFHAFDRYTSSFPIEVEVPPTTSGTLLATMRVSLPYRMPMAG
jgi:hypothetical protein